MAVLLLQESDGGARTATGARSLHSADEAQEHAPPSHGRRSNHAPRIGVLRLTMRGIAGIPLVAVALLGCGSNPKATELRLWSDTYAFRMTVDLLPPRAREPAAKRAVGQD